jgi:hypothetical protein
VKAGPIFLLTIMCSKFNSFCLGPDNLLGLFTGVTCALSQITCSNLKVPLERVLEEQVDTNEVCCIKNDC